MSTDQTASRTRIKICGIKRIEDAMSAVLGGADSIGLVFHPASPRYIEPEDARSLRRELPAFVTVTALFMNESYADIQHIIEQIRPDCLQFHGSEEPEFCEQWQRPYIKAIPMGSITDAAAYAADYSGAQGFLLDSHAAGRQGGSGDTFDWSKIPSPFAHPLILAGGLTPQNVADAVLKVRPYAVDTSSGVESTRGVKDARLIRQFCEEVRRVDCQT